jgi:hypothetical protein
VLQSTPGEPHAIGGNEVIVEKQDQVHFVATIIRRR